MARAPCCGIASLGDIALIVSIYCVIGVFSRKNLDSRFRRALNRLGIRNSSRSRAPRKSALPELAEPGYETSAIKIRLL